jgi:glutamyl-Q tRNA(Asp) synthetase
VDAIFEDLAWLGLCWDTPALRQSERVAAYREALAELDRLGLLYPSFLTRAALQARVAARDSRGARWPRDPDGAPLYPGDERGWSEAKRRREIDSGRPFALRLDMARALAGVGPLAWREEDPFESASGFNQAADPAAWGDVTLARKETPASYHLAVVVDDAFQGVSDVVRGRDLFPATAVHRLLQTLLGLPAPRYFHHRLILDETGAKLSKSRGSESLRARRQAGETPAGLIAGMGLDAR